MQTGELARRIGVVVLAQHFLLAGSHAFHFASHPPSGFQRPGRVAHNVFFGHQAETAQVLGLVRTGGGRPSTWRVPREFVIDRTVETIRVPVTTADTEDVEYVRVGGVHIGRERCTGPLLFRR